MVVWYFGDDSSSSTSFHRAEALRRLGHAVTVYNPFQFVSNKLVFKLQFRTGYLLTQSAVESWVRKIINEEQKPDLIWVDSGELFGPTVVKMFKSLKVPVILYNVDDPTGSRDGARFNILLKALPYFDLTAVVREESRIECEKAGAKRVIRVYRSYDEVAHKPFDSRDQITEKFRSEVAFIGTWMRYENRDQFFLHLLEAGVPFQIWGDRWEKSKYWHQLKDRYRGGALGGRDYVAAMQGSKICLGLLSKGNRDLHTQRSLEVPFAGGLLLAERTSEHQFLYKEGEEAFFWSDSKECASRCKMLLENDTLREQTRANGMAKVRNLKVGNEDVLADILFRL